MNNDRYSNDFFSYDHIVTSTLKLEDTFFPVEIKPVSIQNPLNQSQTIVDKNHKVILDVENQTILGVVSKNYHLITNEEAVNYGKQLMNKLFPSSSETYDRVIVHMPRTRSFCHIDVLPANYRVEILPQDQWSPFFRVTNSYNGSFALTFQIGLMRLVCTNGLMRTKSIFSYRFSHFDKMVNEFIEISKRTPDWEKVNDTFQKQIEVLCQIELTPEQALALMMKMLRFRYSVKREYNEKTEKKFRKLVNVYIRLLERYQEYRSSYSAYGLLNAITDYGSHPKAYQYSTAQTVMPIQRRSGALLEEFSSLFEKKQLNVSKYVGKYLPIALYFLNGR